MSNDIKSVLRFAGIDYKEYESSNADIEAQKKANILEIKKYLPDIEIAENEVVFTNLINKKLCLK